MVEEARRRIRRAFLARNAVSPKLRGQYRRAVHAARVEREARDAPLPPDGSAPVVPPPGERRGLGPVIFLALLPVLLLGFVGVSAMNFVSESIDKPLATISVSSVAQSLAEAGVSGNVVAIPTNTRNAQGTIVPNATPVPRPAETTIFPNLEKNEPFTVLLLGVDSREGDDAPPRSDTMILAYVDPAAKRVNLVSIPRDLRVQMPGNRGQAKMSEVYTRGEDLPKFPGGGVGLVWATLQQNFGVTINYFAQVDFNGFRKIIDAVGGITVDNPYPIKDDEYPTEDYQYTRIYFPAGIMHLNGEEALQYARTRHGDNDYQRNNRQQQVILAIREQAAKTNLFGQANELIAALASTVKTDVRPKDYLALAGLARNIGNDGIRQYSLNNLVFDRTDANGAFLYTAIDWEQARALMREFSKPYVNQDSAARQQAQGANTQLRVAVQNGTRVVGLAKQWSDTLAREGYGRSGDGYLDAPAERKGRIPQTKVHCFGKNEETARVIARTMGLPADAVDSTSARPADAPADADIFIVLGTNAKEP